jgi:hypothetical protein
MPWGCPGDDPIVFRVVFAFFAFALLSFRGRPVVVVVVVVVVNKIVAIVILIV